MSKSEWSISFLHLGCHSMNILDMLLHRLKEDVDFFTKVHLWGLHLYSYQNEADKIQHLLVFIVIPENIICYLNL